MGGANNNNQSASIPQHLHYILVYLSSGVSFDPLLWDPQLFDENGNPKQPLQTNTWWTPFVVPPGETHA